MQFTLDEFKFACESVGIDPEAHVMNTPQTIDEVTNWVYENHDENGWVTVPNGADHDFLRQQLGATADDVAIDPIGLSFRVSESHLGATNSNPWP